MRNNASLIPPSAQFYEQQMYSQRSLHETSGGYLPKRHSDHLSPPTIPGTRVYPYPGTTQEPVRNSYHHSGTHSATLPHHLPQIYLGANNPHSAAVGQQQTYRDNNYQVERNAHEFSATIERYRNRSESNELHQHSSGGTHSGVNVSTGQSSHSQPQIVRRRPSLLPHNIQTNDYNILNSNAALSSAYVNRIERDRYELYRYPPYDNRGKGANIQSASMPLPSTTVSQHNTGPTPLHMVQHGLHLGVGPHHQTGQMIPSQHLSQSHIIQDISDMSANKRPRLTITNDSRPPIHQPLLIDTRDIIEVKKEPAYTPQVEAISPTLPNEDIRQDLSPLRSSKDELLQNINKIDREILQTESQIQKLRKKHQELELVTSKPSAENQELPDNSMIESKQLSVAQLIYSDNKAKTLKAHSQFDKMGPKIELPLYNQPSDTPIYHENKKKFIGFKKKLILYFKKRFHEKQLRERYLTDTYDKLMLSWLKKLEKKETNPTKKTKDIKLREYFEKQFPELRKQREDKERFSRVGQRIRSDAELEEIMDGLQEQELEDKKMRSYAVIPPILLDTRHKKRMFINRNGSIEDPMSEYKERQMLNIWTDQEKEIFREKYLQHPKNFALIASYLERKSVSECVQYYYLSKKGENYKQLLRKHVKKRTRALVKAQQQQQQQALTAQQQRPSPSVGKQNNSEELPKNISTITTLTTTTTTTTTTTATTTTTSMASQSLVNVMTTTTSTPCNADNESLNGPTSGVKSDDTIVNNRNSLKCDNISDSEDMNENNESSCDTYKCCICENKVENLKESRSVTLSNINLYGISNNDFKQGMRVCLMCHFKNVRRQCPLASCKTPRRKVKRLKMLPQLWFEMSVDRRQVYANELNISVESKTACPRCVMRVSRRIGIIAPSERNSVHQSSPLVNNCWTETEIEQIKQLIREHGKNWGAIAAQIHTKNVKECRTFYSNYKYEHNLNKILREFMNNSGKHVKNGESDSEEYWNEMSDGDSEETSSAEEGNDRCNSDTASASSPVSKNIEEIELNAKSIQEKSVNLSCSSTTNNFREDFTKLQDYKGLSTSQGSLKSDYDSSATMSADEGQGICENERLSSSPAVSHPPRANSAMPVFPPSNNIYFQHQPIDKHVRPASHDAAFALDMVSKVSQSQSPTILRTTDSTNVNTRQKVPPFLINPNAPSTHQTNINSSLINSNVNKEEPTCVRDLIYQAIEMSLQSPLKPMRNSNTSPIVNIENKIETHDLINSGIYPLPIVKRENIVDMSKQHDSLSSSRESPSRHCYKNSDLQRPEGLAMMASYSQHLSPSPGHPSHYVILDADNYEVQDLSKKERRLDDYSSSRNYSPSLKEKMILHRNDYPYGYIPPAHSNQSRGSTPINEHNTENKETYPSNKHSDSARNINSGYVLPERMVSQQEDIMQQQCRTSPSNRGLNKMCLTKGSPVPPPPPLITSGKSHQQYSQLSPKMSYREKLVPVSAASGGSITQGTPGIPQQMNYPYGQARYEGLLRQIPKESGSITLGTPLMSGNSNFTIDPIRRKNDSMVSEGNRGEIMSRQNPNLNIMFDPSSVEQYYRRSSPNGHHSYSPSFQQQNTYQSNIHQLNKSPFHKESQLSSKQIMIDFNTSKQMLTRRGSNSSDKDIRSSTPVHGQIESRSPLNEQKHSSQNRLSNSYPNYSHNSGNSPVTQMQSSVYSDRIPHRENQSLNVSDKSQMITSTDTHLSHWSRHPNIGSQSPNYNRQNVIQQHWNAVNIKQSVIQTPKSNSPREYRPEVISPVTHSGMRGSISPQVPITGALYNPSHDAFTTLVNTAAAQQSLAVPNIDRRSGPHPGSRSDPNIRSQMKDKPSVEGLEKSLMEMHGRPRYNDNDSNDIRIKSEDKMRAPIVSQERSLVSGHEEYVYAIEQRRRHEMQQMAEMDRQRYGRPVNEHQNSLVLPQQTLKFTREPFTKEQFERELRHQEPVRRSSDHIIKTKTEEMGEIISESRHCMRPQMSELDNEASKLFSQSFQKDNQKTNSSRGQFTAANLIDAIITHQINSTTDSPNGKNITPTPNPSTPIVNETSPTSGVESLFVRYRNSEKTVQSQYPNREEIVTIADSPDPEKSYPSNDRLPQVSNTPINDYSSKSITFGEHIATIISKNYSNDGRTHTNALMQIDARSSPSVYGMSQMTIEARNSMPPVSGSCGMLEGIAAAAVSNAPNDRKSPLNHSPPHSSWKLRKALQQDKEVKDTDERQIIRIAQNVSPKEQRPVYQSPVKSSSPLSHYNVEPISPPTHSTDNNIQISTPFTPMTTTWSPNPAIQNTMNRSHFYCPESSDVSHSNIPNVVSKQSQQTVTTTNSINCSTNRTNQSPIGLSPLDYVKNRIVEVMRTTTDETNDELTKKSNDIQSLHQNERPIKEEIDSRIITNSEVNERVVSCPESTETSINASNSMNHRQEISLSPPIMSKSLIPITISSSSVTHSSSPSSSQNASALEEYENDGQSLPKKMRKSTDQDSSDCGEAESSAKPSNPTMNTSNDLLTFKSNNSESTISQSSAEDYNNNNTNIKQKVSNDLIPNISSSESNEKSEKTNCESVVSSACNDCNDNTFNEKEHELKPIYPDSPNSPGEMVIDESVSTLTSSSSPIEKTDSELPPSSTTQSTQLSQISTTDVQNSNNKKLLISSSSENALPDVPNQSHSVSSSVIELKKNPIGVSSALSSSVSTDETTQINPISTNSTPQISQVRAQTERYSPSNSANSVSSSGTNLFNVSLGSSISSGMNTSGTSLSQTTANTTGGNDSKTGGRDFDNKNNNNRLMGFTYASYTPFSVSSTAQSTPSIGTTSAEGLTQSTGPTIQSSAISGSGTPSSTTSNVLAPQYEPLSDDE